MLKINIHMVRRHCSLVCGVGGGREGGHCIQELSDSTKSAKLSSKNNREF